MKKILYGMLMLLACLTTVSCSDDEWGSEGEKDKQHWYFYGFEEWYKKTANDVSKDLQRGETIAVPMQFWSERPQNGINAEVEYYFVTTLQLGVDYQVVDESGNTLTPEANGGYKMVWPNCTKGVQNVYVKALQGNTGKIVLQTWDPSRVDDDKISTTNTVIIDHGDYKVSAFTQNYKMTINVK